MVSPMNSRRTGCASPAGKMSTMPPRTANSPCSSAGSSRVKPASTRSSARSVGAMSCPGLSSSAAASRRSGAVTRGSKAAADAITMRAVPSSDGVQGACSSRCHPDVRRQSAIGIDLVRGKGEHCVFQSGLRQAFERRQEERHVGAGLLEIGIGRHDAQDDSLRARLRRAGHVQRLRRRRQARDGARGRSHPAPRNRGLERRPQVQRRRRRHNRPALILAARREPDVRRKAPLMTRPVDADVVSA